MELLGDMGHVESHFILVGIVLVLVQDRCTVCTKRTISSEIILDAPNGTPRRRGSSESSLHLEIVLILTQDRCTVCVERTIGSEIMLDAPNGILGEVAHVESRFFSVWTQCKCRCKIVAHLAPNVPSAPKSLWTHPMVLLGDEAQVEAFRSIWR